MIRTQRLAHRPKVHAKNPEVNPNTYANLVLVILSGERAAHPTNGTGN